MKSYGTGLAPQTKEEWLAERKTYLGGTDAPSVVNVGWGCQLRLFNDKTSVPKDFEAEEPYYFRRGKRLEGIAAAYYAEKTGREVCYTTRSSVPGKPYLSVNMDRIIYRKDDPEKKDPGYLELKVVGEWPFRKIQKEGARDEYALQVQWGMAVSGCAWGAFGIYCPQLDELLAWDFRADKLLGETLLEKGDDFWCFHVECGVPPDPLPEGSKACEGCEWSLTCRGEAVVPASAGVIDRPDLEHLVAKFAEVKGMGSEAEQAAESLRDEILEAVKKQPGVYRCGKYELPIRAQTQKKFQGELLKKADPEMYEKFRVPQTFFVVPKPEEI